jgi:hypothetical protein
MWKEQLVCAQAVLFSYEPFSQKCGNDAFLFRGRFCLQNNFGGCLVQHFCGFFLQIKVRQPDFGGLAD